MRRWMTALVVLLLPALAQASAPQPAPAVQQALPSGPLPRSAEPLHYRLDFTLDPRRDGFDGEARIRVRLHRPAGHVWLHARDLEVRTVRWSAGTQQGSASFAQVNDDGLARVDFGRELAAQDIELHFDYAGRYSTRLESIYKVVRGADSYLVTQFEDIAARRAFPGFDEPAFKTPFELRLTVPEKMKAIANTRQIGDERAESGSKTLSFAATEALPTYLVAFAVGPWDMTKPVKLPANEVRQKPLTLRAFGARGSKPQLAHGLKTTAEILGELERWFGIPYPFDKLDLLAAPDFAFGAMENAGLITFRELLLLLDEKSPVDLQQDHYAVNVHEIAHQWFGNYVTLRWWDDIWLNEAFATWMSAKIAERLRPEYRAGLERLDATLAAMGNDSLVSARRIREPILETADIGLGFDAITYQKGAGVLNMFETWIGEDKFRDGVRLFLQRHARGTATSDDLIAALTEAAGGDPLLASSLRSFLDQAGIPRIDVRVRCGKDRATLQLSQSRYFPLGSKGKQGARWQVPVCVKLGRGETVQRQCFLLTQAKQDFALDGCPDWVLPNEGGNGYYRYALPAAELGQLNAKFDTLTPAEQRVHADSLHAGFRRGDVAPASLLQALPRLAASPLPAVATAPVADLNWLREYAADAAGSEVLRRYAIALYQPQLERLGYATRPGEPQDDTLLRQQLVEFVALDLNGAEAREGLRSAGLALWPQPAATRPPLERGDAALLGPTLALLAQEGGEPVLRQLMDELRQNRDPEQRHALIEALGAVDDPVLAAQVRAFSLEAGLQLRELAALYRGHKRRPANRAAFWAWAQAHYAQLAAPYPSFAQNRIPALLAGRMCSAAEAAELRQFLQPHLPAISGGRRALDQALEAVELCAALRQQAAKPLAQWVRRQVLPPGPRTLADVAASPLRSPAFRSRDLYRHPQQTLDFFGLKPQMSVVEVWPGAGWYSEILAPYLKAQGRYTAAGFVDAPETSEYRRRLLAGYRDKLKLRPDLYGATTLAELGSGRWQPVPPRSADLVLTFRNVHNWMTDGSEREMFRAFFEMLKIGGSLGVVEHRAPPGTSFDDMKRSGYVTEEYVIRLAEEAGFKLHGRSEINANPRDGARHPQGVWTLPPVLRLGETDRAKYLAIGESDRMTLKFVKP